MSLLLRPSFDFLNVFTELDVVLFFSFSTAAFLDSYFHPGTGLLYLTCASSVESRSKWIPDIKSLTSSSKSDYIAIVDTRSSPETQDYSSRIAKIPTTDFWNPENGDLNLKSVGIFINDSASSREGSKMTIYLSNDRPVYASSSQARDRDIIGHNSTIEIFESKLGSKALSHLSTVSSSLIQTPSSILPISESSFVVANSHDKRLNWDRGLVSMVRPLGNVVFCHGQRCEVSLHKSHYPNGMVGSQKEDLFYVSSGSKGYVKKYKFHESSSSLTLVSRNEIQRNDAVQA